MKNLTETDITNHVDFNDLYQQFQHVYFRLNIQRPILSVLSEIAQLVAVAGRLNQSEYVKTLQIGDPMSLEDFFYARELLGEYLENGELLEEALIAGCAKALAAVVADEDEDEEEDADAVFSHIDALGNYFRGVIEGIVLDKNRPLDMTLVTYAVVNIFAKRNEVDNNIAWYGLKFLYAQFNTLFGTENANRHIEIIRAAIAIIRAVENTYEYQHEQELTIIAAITVALGKLEIERITRGIGVKTDEAEFDEDEVEYFADLNDIFEDEEDDDVEDSINWDDINDLDID